MRAAQVGPSLPGRSCPVLAWRLAADVAEERGLPRGPGADAGDRDRPDDRGLPAAPPPLRAAGLDDACSRCSALGACLLMARVLARPARRPAPGSAAARRSALLLGLAALTRNEAVWLGARLGVAGLAAAGPSRASSASAPDRRRRPRSRCSSSRRWASRDWVVFGSPLPGQAISNALSVTGFDIFAWNDPPTLSRYLAVGPGRPARDAGGRACAHNLVNVLLLPGVPDLADRPASRCRGRRATGRCARWSCVGLVTFLVTSLRLPGRDDLGHVPPRGGAGPRAARSSSALLALDAGIACARRPARLDAAGRLARGAARPCSRPLLFSVGAAARRSAAARGATGAHVRGARAAQMAAIGAAARRLRRPGHPRLPDLAGGDGPGPERWRSPTRPPADVLDLARTRFAGHAAGSSSAGGPRRLAGDPGRADPAARCFGRSGCPYRRTRRTRRPSPVPGLPHRLRRPARTCRDRPARRSP